MLSTLQEGKGQDRAINTWYLVAQVAVRGEEEVTVGFVLLHPSLLSSTPSHLENRA